MPIGRRLHLLPLRGEHLAARTQREPRRDDGHHPVALTRRDAGFQQLVFRQPELVRDVNDVQHQEALDPVVANEEIEIAEGSRVRGCRPRSRDKG